MPFPQVSSLLSTLPLVLRDRLHPQQLLVLLPHFSEWPDPLSQVTGSFLPSTSPGDKGSPHGVAKLFPKNNKTFPNPTSPPRPSHWESPRPLERLGSPFVPYSLGHQPPSVTKTPQSDHPNPVSVPALPLPSELRPSSDPLGPSTPFGNPA